MAAKTPTLADVMAELKSVNVKLNKIEKGVSGIEKEVSVLQKSVSGLEKNMEKVLKCVATENADTFPMVKKGGGVSAKAALAAASR